MDHLDDSDRGTFVVTTETSTYVLRLDDRLMMRIPGAPHLTPRLNIVLLAQLGGDREWISLVELIQCRIGDELIALTEPKPDSIVYRQSTLVRAIQPFVPSLANEEGRAEPDMRPRFYDRSGEPITREALMSYLKDPDYRFLARTRVGPLEVVTAWLGIDQALDYSGAPLIFGTAILADTDIGQLFEDREYLASSEQEAMDQHHYLAEQLRLQDR